MRNRRGSALLVVLGMLAFMVISAVAFSAYMRYSRLPSSYLRRASSSRLLVKAALAEAIDEIDVSIGNNPHPGLGTHQHKYEYDTNSRTQGGRTENRNGWIHHVFLGTNVLASANDPDTDANNKLVSADDTVSTLTLEGLAYVPPALVNEARYYSRRSRAAQWKNLDFEAGRYAFCAIDVSGYLDVNSIAANFGRGATPATRFSLAYLFEEPVEHKSYVNQPDAWDTFIKKFWQKTAAEADIGQTSVEVSSAEDRKASSKVPLVSLADLNLAIGANAPAGLESPFYKFVKNAGSGSFYGGIGETGASADKIRNMPFVTDGYFPTEPDVAKDLASGDVADLATEEGQPFTRGQLEQNSLQLSTIMNNGSTAANLLRKYISGLGLAMLYDYLDEDNVPISLAIPSVERVPMVAAFEHDFTSAKIEFVQDPANPPEIWVGAPGNTRPAAGTPGQTIQVQQALTWKLKADSFSAPGTIKAVLTYPFRLGRDLAHDETFNVDGLVEFFFTSGNMTFRTGNASDCLHVKPNGNSLERADTTCPGVFAVPLAQKPYGLGDVAPQREDDADVIKELTFNTQNGAGQIASQLGGLSLFTVVQQKTMKWDDTVGMNGDWVEVSPYQPVPQLFDGSATTSCGIPPLKADGSVDTAFTTPNTFLGLLQNGGAKMQLRMAVWLRVKNKNGKTVDQVPACFADDHSVSGQNDQNGSGGGPRAAFMNIDGGSFPILRFDDASTIELTQAGPQISGGGATSAPFNLTPKAVMCPDPRWNHAPENWFTPGSSVSRSDWLQNCGRGGDRDHDIFMDTSDAGYMQSVYELAFLPRITSMQGTDNKDYGLVGAPSTGNANWNASFNDVSHKEFMWRTYSPYRRNNVMRDPFEWVGLVNDGGGMKINPYSDCTNALMAAFANAPVGWWASAVLAKSANGVPQNDRKNAKTFNQQYAFSAMNADAPFAWKDLYAIAQNFVAAIRRRAPVKLDDSAIHLWKECWDGVVYGSDGLPDKNPTDGQVPQNQYLDWNGDNSDFCGINFQGETDEFFDIHRKFLYGYWRECFAPKQQLFLVFVRAEPTLTGGSGIRQMPPQLGARAVALVWRDPYPSNDDNSPHRTRILFYRQLD